MLNEQEVLKLAHKAIETAERETAHGTFNDGYVHGFADALKRVAELKYYAVSADDGSSWTWQWLTDKEAETEQQAGRLAKR